MRWFMRVFDQTYQCTIETTEHNPTKESVQADFLLVIYVRIYFATREVNGSQQLRLSTGFRLVSK